MSHTPGPWKVQTFSAKTYMISTFQNGLIAQHVPGEANARLIAAAPEMYEELREMLYYARCVYEQHGGDDEQRGLAPKVKKDIDRVEALLRRVDPEEDEHHDQP